MMERLLCRPWRSPWSGGVVFTCRKRFALGSSRLKMIDRRCGRRPLRRLNGCGVKRRSFTCRLRLRGAWRSFWLRTRARIGIPIRWELCCLLIRLMLRCPICRVVIILSWFVFFIAWCPLSTRVRWDGNSYLGGWPLVLAMFGARGRVVPCCVISPLRCMERSLDVERW